MQVQQQLTTWMLWEGNYVRGICTAVSAKQVAKASGNCHSQNVSIRFGEQRVRLAISSERETANSCAFRKVVCISTISSCCHLESTVRCKDVAPTVGRETKVTAKFA
uniref:Uncharacterized protein n=1 Tax=Trichuris muris TaxID=70415 RepID=A0A5S6R3T6_TRIMR